MCKIPYPATLKFFQIFAFFAFPPGESLRRLGTRVFTREDLMPTVMVVDDADLTRDTLSRLLRREGYSTLQAATGKEALHVLEEQPQPPDLVLLDVNMPDLDGLQLLEMLHDNPHWRALPVIMLTAQADTHTIRRAEQLGAKEFLVKAAFSLHEMLDHVRHYTRYTPS
jgi:CheY-like chemotaxis protein